VNGKVVHLDPDAHQALQELLPWYVIDRLAPAQRAEVDSHLVACPRCQAEVQAQRRLRDLTAALPSADSGDVEAALARLRGQIESERKPGGALEGERPGHRPAHAGGVPRHVPHHVLRSWQWAAVMQAVLLIGLGLALSIELLVPTAAYRALGAPGAGAGNAVVKFRPDATEAQVRAALTATGARIVNGPTASDAYVVSVPPSELEDAIARLRREPSVLLVESLDGKAVP
jgi:anti-sigma factor RsiW